MPPRKDLRRNPRKPRPRHPRDPIADAIKRVTDRLVDTADVIMDQLLDRFFPGQYQPQSQSQPRSRTQQQQQRQDRQSPPPPHSLYEVLEVSESASPETITAAWKSLSKRYHPDNQSTGNAEKIKLINGAYDMLSDPAKRRLYDRMLRSSRS